MLSKKVVLLVTICFVVVAAVSLIFHWGGTGLGVFSILFAIANLFFALIFALMKRYNASKSFLLMGGVFLLIGFGLCSAFPFNIH